jgi:dTDP-4-dehydrorhamnose reductase
LQRSFAGRGDILSFDRQRFDVSDAKQVRAMVKESAPDLILNAAAYTAVDRAETERETASATNATGPRVLAEEARRRDILLVHYSTDYVFDGSKKSPWVETDRTNPLNYYGASKLRGEEALAEIGGKYLIFRTSWVYGPHGSNFLLTMLRLGKQRDSLKIVDDQIGAPTSSMALADATRIIVEGALLGRFGEVEHWAGLYHMTCGGEISWCGFAKEIFARSTEYLGGRKPKLEPIPTEAYPTPATRPRYSILSNGKLAQRFGIQLPDWTAELDRTLLQLPTVPA